RRQSSREPVELRRGLQVRAGTRVARERGATELGDDEARLVELDLVPTERRRSVPLHQLVAGARLDEQEMTGRLLSGLSLGHRLRCHHGLFELLAALRELARPEL